mmetsp:Transcript_39726/g.113253  ORF Transcript_39726/g.113253 Transcript_39726/m.113253 type:complete len:456 (+) Transcript_39726:180-1547(+)
MKIVDFARRTRFTPANGVVDPPKAHNQAQLARDGEMYGLKIEKVYKPILTDEDMQAVIDMTNKRQPTKRLLYKSSRDTWSFGSLLDSVGDASGLLFVMQYSATNKSGFFLDGQLNLPPKPTGEMKTYCPIFFYSASGPYQTATKVPIPEDAQAVLVGGRLGAVMDNLKRRVANLFIGGDSTDSAGLWLGFQLPTDPRLSDGPAPDLSHYCTWVKEGHLPEGYTGSIDEDGDGTLAGAEIPPPLEGLEVWQVSGEYVFEPILSDEQMQAVIAMTNQPSHTRELLYKATRDGWRYGRLIDSVGDASGLLVVVQHNDTHRFGAFIDGQLKQPSDPTKEAQSECRLFFYSVSGACGNPTPTKVPIPEENRSAVSVAGREGVAQGRTYLSIDAWDSAYLELGSNDHDVTGPSGDLHRCRMWISKASLPAGYVGQVDADGDGTLAGAQMFTASDIEVWRVG